jgi:hypothetical protein
LTRRGAKNASKNPHEGVRIRRDASCVSRSRRHRTPHARALRSSIADHAPGDADHPPRPPEGFRTDGDDKVGVTKSGLPPFSGLDVKLDGSLIAHLEQQLLAFLFIVDVGTLLHQEKR